MLAAFELVPPQVDVICEKCPKQSRKTKLGIAIAGEPPAG
jgi:hypothetical protein